MKKAVFICVFVMVAALCGCGAKSIGIIGGADGPTSIVVTDGSEKTEYEKVPVRILRLDGKLYYETKYPCQTEGRCGTMDGNFEKTAEEFEVPQNDNESNFSDASAYQLGQKENTVEILIGDSFKKFDLVDTNSDVLNYKYCFVLKGGLPYAESDSRFLVLSNEKNIDFEDAKYKLLGSNLSKMKDIYVLPIE